MLHQLKKRTNNSTSNEYQRLSVIVNNQSPWKLTFTWKKVSEKSLKKVSEKKIFQKKKYIVYNFTIVAISLRRGIRLPKFNYWLHKRYAQLKSFCSGSSKKLLYYVESTLKNKKFDVALLHVGVNDLHCPKSSE